MLSNLVRPSSPIVRLADGIRRTALAVAPYTVGGEPARTRPVS